jgi:glycosyltransferase involved in cell wall biosynthesis
MIMRNFGLQMKRPDKIVLYELEHLQAEFDLFLGGLSPLALKILVHPLFRLFTHHLQNFYWTVTRLVGLGYWHDGSTPKPPLTSRPVLETAAAPQRPRILVDLTQTFFNGGQTGIQRVMREIAKAAVKSGAGFPVIIKDGSFLPYYQNPVFGETIEIVEGDLLLLLDSAWYAPHTYLPVMQEVVRKGGGVVLGVYDLIPLTYPWVHKVSVELLRTWLERAVPLADGIVTISRSVANDICDYIAATGVEHKPNLGVGWHHLGADFASDASAPPSQKLVDLCNCGPLFLSVGTIEPRKGHPVALSAFEKLWNAGIDARYLMIGQYGWSSHSVRKRILEHPEYGRRLFWLDRANDADLSYAYRRATSLVCPSFAEGFGLPLIEAARYGVPVIASDIPVFHEIGGDAISYFDVLDADSLATRIRDAVAGKTIKPSFPILTWQEAADGFMRLIRNGDYQFSLGVKSARATSDRSVVGMN